MRFGPERQHPTYIFEGFVGTFGPLLIALVVAAVTRNPDLILNSGIIMAFILIGPVSRLIGFFRFTVSVNKDNLVIDQGIFVRKHKELPISSIATINLSQNIIQQFFHSYRMVLDNASSMGDEQETVIIMGEKNMKELLAILKPDGKGITEGGAQDAEASWAGPLAGEDGAGAAAAYGSSESAAAAPHKRYGFSSGKLILYGMLSSKAASIAKILAAIIVIFQFVGDVVEDAFFDLIERSTEGLIEATGEAASSGATGIRQIIVTALLFLLMSYIVTVVWAGLWTLVKYHEYTLTDMGDKLGISYGLFTKKNYTIDKSRVSGIRYKQSLFMRLLHFGSLECIAIGYGTGKDNNNIEDPLIMPLVTDAELESDVKTLFPDIAVSGETIRPAREDAYYFLFRPAFVISLILFIASLVCSVRLDFWFFYIGLAILALGFVHIVLQYRNMSVTAGELCTRVTEGAFNKTTYLIKTAHIEGIEETASILKRRRGVSTVTLFIYAQSNHAYARNVKLRVFSELSEKLIF